MPQLHNRSVAHFLEFDLIQESRSHQKLKKKPPCRQADTDVSK